MPSAKTAQALAAESALVGEGLLGLDEDQWFERKSQRIAPRELANVLAGFANAQGGTVAIGVSNGRIEGTDSQPRQRNAHMQAAVDFCVPPVRAESRLVECLRDDGNPDHLLVMEVEPGDLVAANVKDEVYLRIGDETRRLTFAQRQELLFDKGQATYESRPVKGALPWQVDGALLNYYATALQHPDPARLLLARGLATDDALTVAGLLLFGEAPQRFIPESFIRVLRYAGRERGSGARQQLLSDVKIEGPIPNQIVAARSAVSEQQPSRRALTASGRFGDVALVPEDAWLEGIVNAAVHRSYSLAGDHIRVEIFDDRIEISSPGRFPGLVDLSDPLGAPRFARNPRIARACADLAFGQELGEGIRRMFEEMRHAGLTDPLFRQTAGSVQLTLSAEPADRRLDAHMPDEVRAISAALRDAGRLSTGELVEILGVSRPTVIGALRALQAAEVVSWVGKSPRDPRAYWTLRRS